MPISVANLLDTPSPPFPEEIVETILQSSNVRVERIVSAGHTTPEGEWYDQPWPEWVVVLQGRARLRFEWESTTVDLRAGYALTIPAHCRHRVEWSDPAEPTVWLAVHYTP